MLLVSLLSWYAAGFYLAERWAARPHQVNDSIRWRFELLLVRLAVLAIPFWVAALRVGGKI